MCLGLRIIYDRITFQQHLTKIQWHQLQAVYNDTKLIIGYLEQKTS